MNRRVWLATHERRLVGTGPVFEAVYTLSNMGRDFQASAVVEKLGGGREPDDGL